jgi:type VI secretion system protein
MREHRLLERIANFVEGGDRTDRTRIEVLQQSILEHLTRLLNTRQGSVLIDPLFGVPDFTNLTGGMAMGSTREIEDEISRMVTKYEPRIQCPKVTFMQESTNVLSLQFTLEGWIEADREKMPLKISTAVGSNGRVSVRHV